MEKIGGLRSATSEHGSCRRGNHRRDGNRRIGALCATFGQQKASCGLCGLRHGFDSDVKLMSGLTNPSALPAASGLDFAGKSGVVNDNS